MYDMSEIFFKYLLTKNE